MVDAGWYLQCRVDGLWTKDVETLQVCVRGRLCIGDAVVGRKLAQGISENCKRTKRLRVWRESQDYVQIEIISEQIARYFVKNALLRIIYYYIISS